MDEMPYAPQRELPVKVIMTAVMETQLAPSVAALRPTEEVSQSVPARMEVVDTIKWLHRLPPTSRNYGTRYCRNDSTRNSSSGTRINLASSTTRNVASTATQYQN